mgnify:CR=1 FL=1
MARDIQEIKAQLKTAFVENITLQELYGLDAAKGFDEQFSKVSIEARLIDVFGAGAWVLEQLWDVFRSETEAVIDDSYVTSERWYYAKALEFQKGDALRYNEKAYRFEYAVKDETKQVVRNVAVRQVTDEDVTKLKVYFSDTNKEPLTGDVRMAFEKYMREIGAAGTHYLFVSEAPDELRVHLHVYYDALLLDSTGTRLNGGGKPVEEAVESYLNGLEYGGVMYASKLIDVIQQAEGVKDVTLDGTTWKGAMEERRRIDADSGAFVYVKVAGDIVYAID